MTKRVLTEKVAGLMTTYVAKGAQADRAKANAVDALVAAGFVSTDMISPKKAESTADDELHAQIGAAIVAGFSARAQALLAKPSTKGLTDSQIGVRRYAMQQIGAKRNDFKRGMQRRLDAASPDGGASRTRTIDEWFRDMANDGIKKCRAAEEAPFDIADMIKACEAVLKLAKR